MNFADMLPSEKPIDLHMNMNENMGSASPKWAER